MKKGAAPTATWEPRVSLNLSSELKKWYQREAERRSMTAHDLMRLVLYGRMATTEMMRYKRAQPWR